jgi:hypothetical protein
MYAATVTIESPALPAEPGRRRRNLGISLA